MRYQSIYNEESNKYYILDTIRNAKISEYEYDIIIQIFEDTYAVVGNRDAYQENPFTEKVYYKYGLIDMSGKVVLDMHYKFIYIHANLILCNSRNGKILEKTMLGQTIWHNQKGKLYISDTLLDFDSEYAIIEYSLPAPTKSKIFTTIYQKHHELIDVYGNVIERDESYNPVVKLPTKPYPSMRPDYALLTDYHICKYGYDGRVNMTDNKWLKIFNALEDICVDRMSWFNLTLPNGLRFEKFHFEVINDTFFLIKQSGYYSRYLCVLDHNMNALHYDPNGFYAEKIGQSNDLEYIHISYNNSYVKTHLPKWICNDDCDESERPFFLKINGDKFYLPSQVSIHSHSSNNRFVPIYDENHFGYINLHGEIVVPPIFELEKERYLDVDPKDVDYNWDNEEENRHYSKLDAVDGDEDALWNID